MSNLVQKFQEYSQWRSSVVAALERYRSWVSVSELLDPAGDQRFAQARARLADDKLTIAFVAEFSRGAHQSPNLTQDEAFAAVPGGDQCQ